MNTLARNLLISTVFISSIYNILPAQAARLIINGSDQLSCPIGNCGDNGNGGVDFQTDNKLNVLPGENVGQTGGVSVIASGGNNIGEIQFNGLPTSVIFGSVTPTGNILRLITLDNNANVQANGDIRVTTLNMLLGNLTLVNGVNLTADITGGGSLFFLGTSTVTGNIAASPVQITPTQPGSVVRIIGNVGSNITFFGDAEVRIAPNKNITGYVATTAGINTGTLTFEGSSIGGGPIGAHFGPNDVLKQVNFNGGVFTLNNNIAAQNTVVNACATLLVPHNVSIGPSLINNGIVQVGTTAGVNTLSVGNYQGNAGSSLNLIVLNGGANYSRLTASGPVVIPDNGLKLIITGNTIPNNTVLNNIITTPALALAPNTPRDTATYHFITSYVPPNLDITVQTTPMTTVIANTPLLLSMAQFFDSIGPNIQTIAPGLIPILDALHAQPDAASLKDALGSLTLPVNGNLLAPAYGSAMQSFHIISERMDNNRAEFARGDARYKCATSYPYCCFPKPCYSMHSGQWIEFYATDIDQASLEGLDGSGYTALQWGVIAGYDKAFYPSLNAGAAIAYTKTDTTSKGVFNNTLSADTFQGFLYASHELCNGLYWDGIVGVTYNDYYQQRVIDLLSHIDPFPTSCGIPSISVGLLENAKSKFGGWQFNGYLEGGYQYRSCGFVLRPHVLLRSTYLRLDEFSETGAPMAGLQHIQYADMQDTELGLGIQLAKNYICCKKYRLTPYVKLIALHDLVDTQQTGTAQFIAGGPYFTQTGVGRGENAVVTSIGLTLNRKDNSFLSFEYDFEQRNNYVMYSGFLKYRVEWC